MAHGPHECPPFDSLPSLYVPRFDFPPYISLTTPSSLSILIRSTPFIYFGFFGAFDQ